MKVMISFLSLIIVFIGIIPFFNKFPIPNSGTGYSVVLIVLGILVIVMGIINKLLMGFEKFIVIVQGMAVVGVGMLPFFPALLSFIPRTGLLYNGIVIVIGVLGLVYGFLGMG